MYNNRKKRIEMKTDIINWGELSRLLTGSRLNIRKNRIPKRYIERINRLKVKIDEEIATWHEPNSV